MKKSEDKIVINEKQCVNERIYALEERYDKLIIERDEFYRDNIKFLKEVKESINNLSEKMDNKKGW
jgi:hypothetical protein